MNAVLNIGSKLIYIFLDECINIIIDKAKFEYLN